MKKDGTTDPQKKKVEILKAPKRCRETTMTTDLEVLFLMSFCLCSSHISGSLYIERNCKGDRVFRLCLPVRLHSYWKACGNANEVDKFGLILCFECDFETRM